MRILSLARIFQLMVLCIFLKEIGHAQLTETVIYTFSGGGDSATPMGSIIADDNGNLYGTTFGGDGNNGTGTVYEMLAPKTKDGTWSKVTLHSFLPYSDGAYPLSGVIADKAGNLYGTTKQNGPANEGTVFELMPPGISGGSWTFSVLYSFPGATKYDGQYPYGGLVMDNAGNLYGTTAFGGGAPGCRGGCGTVFELSPPSVSGGAWTENILYRFKGGNDGADPVAGMTFDPLGNLYGTTQAGGSSDVCSDGYYGCGIVFMLKPPSSPDGSWREIVINRFQVGNLGAGPNAPLSIHDKALYSTTQRSENAGRVFEVAQIHGAPTESEVYGWADCDAPIDAGVTFDSTGNIYGTTASTEGFCVNYFGSIYQLEPPLQKGDLWTESAVYHFSGGNDGANPNGGVIIFDGITYGTASSGGDLSCNAGNGTGCGVVFSAQ